MNRDAIKTLRSAIPIPLLEAKQLLLSNNDNIEKCIVVYKDKLAKDIVSKTNCSINDAKRILEKEKYDITKSLSQVIENEYDKQYIPIDGIDKNSLLYARDWLYLLEGKDLSETFNYKHYDKFIEVLYKLKVISHLGDTLLLAKKDYDKIFDGYTNDMPIEEFIRRNTLLDVSVNFQQASKCVTLEIENIKDEFRRQWRNVNK